MALDFCSAKSSGATAAQAADVLLEKLEAPFIRGALAGARHDACGEGSASHALAVVGPIVLSEIARASEKGLRVIHHSVQEGSAITGAGEAGASRSE